MTSAYSDHNRVLICADGGSAAVFVNVTPPPGNVGSRQPGAADALLYYLRRRSTTARAEDIDRRYAGDLVAPGVPEELPLRGHQSPAINLPLIVMVLYRAACLPRSPKRARVTVRHSAAAEAALVVGAATDRTALLACEPLPARFRWSARPCNSSASVRAPAQVRTANLVKNPEVTSDLGKRAFRAEWSFAA